MFAGYGKSLSLVAVLALAVPVAALAQSTSSQMSGIALSNDKPIQIESDKLQIKDKENRADFSGNIKVVQGSTTLRSNTMTVYYVGKNDSVVDTGSQDIKSVTMDGNVRLSSGKQSAQADTGHFDMASQTLVLEGKRVVLLDGDNVFTGCRLTVEMQSGEAQLDSCGGRVQIQLDPKSSNK